MLRLTKIAAVLSITFTVLIAAAHVLGAQAKLPPLRLIDSSERDNSVYSVTYVDPNRSVISIRQETRSTQQETQRITIENPDSDHITEIVMTPFTPFTSVYPQYNLRVMRDGKQVLPPVEAYNFPEGYHSPDNRYWYLFDTMTGHFIQYDAYTDDIAIVRRDLHEFHGCFEFDPTQCVIRTGFYGGEHIMMLNLTNGVLHYIDKVSGYNEHITNVAWMTDQPFLLYATPSADQSAKTLIAYNPTTNEKHVIADHLGVDISLFPDIDPSHMIVTGYDPYYRNNITDIIVVDVSDSAAAPEITFSLEAVYGDVQYLEIYNWQWSPALQKLVFFIEVGDIIHLYAASASDQSLTHLMELPFPADFYSSSLRLSPDGQWAAFITNNANTNSQSLIIIPTDGHAPARTLNFVDITVGTRLNGWVNWE